MASPYERCKAEQKGGVIAGMVILEVIIAGGLAYPCWKVWSDSSRGDFNWNTFGFLSAIIFGLSIAGLMAANFLSKLQQINYFRKYGVSVAAEGKIVGKETRRRDSFASTRSAYFAVEEIRYMVGDNAFKVTKLWNLKRGMEVGDKRTLTIRYDPKNPEYTDYSQYDLKIHPPSRLRNILSLVCVIMLLVGLICVIIWIVHRMKEN